MVVNGHGQICTLTRAVATGCGLFMNLSEQRRRVNEPYKGGPEALADVLAGHVDFYYCPISTALPFLQEGRLRALAVSTPTRAAALPDVPTSIEAGYPGSDYTVWYGVFMPAKTPDQIVERFYQATTKALQTPALCQKFAQLAVDPLPLTPKQFD